MKNTYFILIGFLVLSNISFAQDLEIATIAFYEKSNYEWKPKTIHEYEITPYLEESKTYSKTDNGWEKVKDYSRRFIGNTDSIEVSIRYWANDVLTNEKKWLCYQETVENQIYFVAETDGKQKRLEKSLTRMTWDDVGGCKSMTYPFQDVIMQADGLWRAGIPLKNQKLIWETCFSQNFILTPDKYNRLKEMESEYSKLILTYQSTNALKLEEFIPNKNRVFPNPFSNNFFIEIPDGDIEKVEIIDNFGKRIYFLEVKNKTKINVELLDVPAGLYILNLYSNNEISTHKLIKS